MNSTRPTILRTPLTSFSSYMSSNSKPRSHYVTLKVDHDATQEEIKTAYYKLTKKFHPDVNKSEEAKEKFRIVSEAYEILGNYKARKQYDRGMIARGITKPSENNEKNDPHMAFYKSRMDNYPKPVRTSDSKQYNFDAWTRAHYGDTFKKTLRRKVVNQEIREYKINVSNLDRGRDKEQHIVIGFIVVLIVAMFLLEVKDNYDIVAENNVENAEKSEG